MGIANEFLIWRSSDRLFCRVTTNVDLDYLRARLAHIGLLDDVEDIRAFFADRVKGGSGYELLFARHAAWNDVRQVIIEL